MTEESGLDATPVAPADGAGERVRHKSLSHVVSSQPGLISLTKQRFSRDLILTRQEGDDRLEAPHVSFNMPLRAVSTSPEAGLSFGIRRLEMLSDSDTEEDGNLSEEGEEGVPSHGTACMCIMEEEEEEAETES